MQPIMGKTADLTAGQRTGGKAQEVIAEKAGCWQSAVSKHINDRLNERQKCDLEKKGAQATGITAGLRARSR